MSKEFIEGRIGSQYLTKAVDQQKQIQYFTQSEIQKDITQEYLTQWAVKQYRTDDYFLNFIKVIFRNENFLSFFKYFRNPNPSSGLVNDTIVPALRRVFHSEDSYFKYTVKGENVNEPECLKCNKFDNKIFRAILFRHNDILIHDLEAINKPYRHLVSIENVVAIESEDSEIYKIAYSAEVPIINEFNETEKKKGYVYLDSEYYAFYDNEYNQLLKVPHDLGECPADYIVPYPFKDEDPVRRSIFSFVREKLEEYTFLKTLQRLTEPNGAFPVTTKLKTQENKKDDSTAIDSEPNPMSSGKIPISESSPIQAASTVSVPVIQDENGKVNMEVVEKFFNFFYIPVDILKYINERIQQIENEITQRILGDFQERNEEAMNRTQVKKGYVSAEDRLRVISEYLSRIRTISDFKMMALEFGRDNVSNEAFFGSDFFLATEEDLYNLFEKSPNTIERKNLLKKISSTRYKFNPDRRKRESILYDLMPFVSDKDFAAASEGLDRITMLYQTRFNYWISQVEAAYGDIVSIWNSMEEVPNSQKLIFINNLVENFIKDYDSKNSNVQDDEVS